MKKVYLTFILPLLAMSIAFAQSEKQATKSYPALIELTDVSAAKKSTILQEQFQLRQEDEMKSVKSFEDEIGMIHEKFQQFYKGVPVDGATYTIHTKGNKITALSGNFRTVNDLEVNPALASITAFSAAVKHVGAETYMWEEGQDAYKSGHSCVKDDVAYKMPAGELVVVADAKGGKAARLAYKFDIYAVAPLSRSFVFIDAHTGEFIMEQNRLCTAFVNGTCSTLYNGTQNITVENTGPYRLRNADVQTYDLNNGTNYNNASDVTSNSTSFGSASATANQAHFGAEKTHSYFLTKHNRDSYNGAGAIIRSYVSYSSNYVNAFWDGSRMTYGDGDGVNYGPLVSLDIVGHEIVHGVTQYAANLVYSYESGALNESFSDIFGECIENYAQGNNDWLMGDAIGAGGSGGALRNMANPNQYGHPDTYGGTSWYTGSGDNGGVHINSGVQNKWFHLLCVGGSGTNDLGTTYNVNAIGMEKAAAIAYRNLTVYLSANSNYAAARSGAIQAATDLYGAGSAEVTATTEAWCAVGVGACAGTNPPSSDCGTDATTTLTLVTDNYGSETSWTLSSGGTTIESGSGYANNTTYTLNWSLGAGDYTFTINDSYGDGICCSYGQGSYTISNGGATLASGGSFTTTESKTFCVEGSAPPSGGCTAIDVATATFNAYGAGQDNGTATQNGTNVMLTGNAWKAISLDYTVTPNTVIEFDFGSVNEGEIHGIGFDADDAISSDRTFQVHGTQSWGILDYNNYSQIGYWTSYSIPVGQYYTGSFDRLFFVADHDASPNNGDSYFQNVKIHEGGGCPALTAVISQDGIKILVEDNSLTAKRSGIQNTIAKADLFPNPASDVLNVSLAPEFAGGQMTVVDLYGKVILTQTVSDVNMELNVAELSSGMYFLNLQNGKNKQTEKFVVKH